MTVVGGIDALRPAVQRVCDAALALGVPPRRLDDVRLAVHEVILNAVEHGHGGDPRLPVDVEVAGSATVVRVRVMDRGAGADLTAGVPAWVARVPAHVAGVPAWVAEVPEHVAEVPERGHGLRLVAGLVDGLDVDVGQARTTVTVVFDTAPR